MKIVRVKMAGGKMVEGRESLVTALVDGEYELVIYPAGDEWVTAQDIVAQYLHAGEAMPVGDLLNLQDKLTIICSNLARKTGLGFRDYTMAYGRRKIARSKKYEELMDKNGLYRISASQAEKEVDGHIEALILNESEHEGNSRTMELVLQSMWKVIGAIQQRISHEKAEYRNAKFQNG